MLTIFYSKRSLYRLLQFFLGLTLTIGMFSSGVLDISTSTASVPVANAQANTALQKANSRDGSKLIKLTPKLFFFLCFLLVSIVVLAGMNGDRDIKPSRYRRRGAYGGDGGGDFSGSYCSGDGGSYGGSYGGDCGGDGGGDCGGDGGE